MFARFNLELDDAFFHSHIEKQQPTNNLKNLLLKEVEFLTKNDLDASKTQENFFPSIKADIFISHAHKDEKKTKFLANWLYSNFELKSFIDSDVWSYYPEVVDALKKHMLIDEAKTLAHIMLNTALHSMIDNTDAFFLLNTSKSINNQNRTYSPWIYSEISCCNIIRLKPPSFSSELSEKIETLAGMEHFRSSFKVDLREFITLNTNDLKLWMKNSKNSHAHPLAILYEKSKKDKSMKTDCYLKSLMFG